MEWWDRAHLELANLREAMQLCVAEPGEAERGLMMAANLAYYWISRANAREGRRWLDALLEAAPEATRGRTMALGVDGWLALMQGDTAKALELLRECETVAEDLGDEAALSWTSFALGGAVVGQGDLDRAEVLLERSLRLQEGLPDRRNAALALMHLAVLWSQRGDHSRALELFGRASDLCREVGDRYFLAWNLQGGGIEAFQIGDLDRASAMAAEGLRLSRAVDNQVGMAFSIEILAWIATATGRTERAAGLLGGLQSMWEAIPAKLYPPYVQSHDVALAAATSSLGDRGFNRAYRDGGQMSPEQLVSLALEEREPVVPRPTGRRSSTELTPRELEIAGLVAQGLSNRDIASKLVISQRTAETHVEHILSKLGFTSRAQIAAWVVEEEARAGSPGPAH